MKLCSPSAGLSQPQVRGILWGQRDKCRVFATSSMWRAQALSEKGQRGDFVLSQQNQTHSGETFAGFIHRDKGSFKGRQTALEGFSCCSKLSPLIPDLSRVS